MVLSTKRLHPRGGEISQARSPQARKGLGDNRYTALNSKGYRESKGLEAGKGEVVLEGFLGKSKS